MESASINKSLFVLAKCVEAISEKQVRIPYRESKMTRILSLGQNNGVTLMILNLAPVRSYHLDTLSSLNFANRTKKIEVREIENEPVFEGCARAVPAITGSSMQRQPLRPLANTVHNTAIRTSNPCGKQGEKPPKAFSVYSDMTRPLISSTRPLRVEASRHPSPFKRPLDLCSSNTARPQKKRSPTPTSKLTNEVSRETIEDMIERKVTDILAARALDQPLIGPGPEISEEVQRRLKLLEQKLQSQNDDREQGLTFLLMAKQHSVRGEHASALKMYSMAKEYFPNNAELEIRIERLREKVHDQKHEKRLGGVKCKERESSERIPQFETQETDHANDMPQLNDVDQPGEEEYHNDWEAMSNAEYETTDSFQCQSKSKKNTRRPPAKAATPGLKDAPAAEGEQTPRTQQLLALVNTRDVRQIRQLKGVGAKKAGAILEAVCAGAEKDEEQGRVCSLAQLGRLKGVGARTVENMRSGLGSAVMF